MQRCEYKNCQKKGIVSIMRWNYCIEHSLVVLSSLYFLETDNIYEMFEKVIRALADGKRTIKEIHDTTGLHYTTIKKILQRLESLHVVEKHQERGREVWMMVTNKYLGLI